MLLELAASFIVAFIVCAAVLIAFRKTVSGSLVAAIFCGVLAVALIGLRRLLLGWSS
jgi:hypothetical protein